MFHHAILVAHHRGNKGPLGSRPYLNLFQQPTALRVWEAVHGERVRGGTVYLAPPGRHLELDDDGRFYTDRLDRPDWVLPSADLLFESVAAYYGDRSVAIVLSGFGRDGSSGVRAVRERGGFVIAQDRVGCDHFDMPCSAIETRRVDIVLPLRHIGFALNTIFGSHPSVA